MSAFETYLVMQCSEFRAALFVLSLLFTFFSYLAYDKKKHDASGVIFLVGFALALIGVCVPSTKTACAMVLVPAITQNEELREDFDDIYELGLERIREALENEDER